MKTYQCFNKKTKLYLGNEIKSGGEGKILETITDWEDSKEFVAKIYHKEMDEEKIKKLKIMVDNPPRDPMSSKGGVSIAWPIDLILDVEDNKIIGFLMPKICKCLTLVNVYSRKYRVQKAPLIDWRWLHVIAQNVASIVDAIHSKGYIIGDIKADNFLVNIETMVVTIVDTDSFQIPGKHGEIYDCQVMTKDYAAPELQNQLFKYKNGKVLRTKEHDVFSLAILIHYIIFGANPFVRKANAKDSESTSEKIIQDSIIVAGEYFGISESRIKKRKHLIPPNIVHNKLQIYIKRCFETGYDDHKFRPTAKQWKIALMQASRSLLNCDQHQSHWYNQKSGCYWCQSLEKIDYFPDFSKEEIIEVEDPAKQVVSAPVTPSLPKTSNIVINKVNFKLAYFGGGLILTGILIIIFNYYVSSFSKKSVPVIIKTSPFPMVLDKSDLLIIKDVENYFKGRWKADPNFDDNLQYILQIGKNGRLISIYGETESSILYINRTNFLKSGIKISQVRKNDKNYKVHLTLTSNGLVIVNMM